MKDSWITQTFHFSSKMSAVSVGVGPDDSYAEYLNLPLRRSIFISQQGDPLRLNSVGHETQLVTKRFNDSLLPMAEQNSLQSPSCDYFHSKVQFPRTTCKLVRAASLLSDYCLLPTVSVSREIIGLIRIYKP
jgi:hypothetical protein